MLLLRTPAPDIRLVACDLDGTLVSPERTITDRTVEAVSAVQAAGAIVALVTGRPPRFVGDVPERSGAAGPVICSNGAVVFDPVTASVVSAKAIPGEILTRVVAAARKEVPRIAFGVEWDVRFSFEPEFAKRLVGDRPTPVVDNVIEASHLPVHKLLANHDELDAGALLEALVGVVDSQVTMTHAGLSFVEMAAAGVTKASGLEVACRDRGINASHVVAFGDRPNDVPMLEWAGIGIAMANADDVVKDVADYVTDSNANDGVAVVLEMIAARDFGWLHPPT